MLGKLILYGAIIVGVYWYWSGPYQDGGMSGYDNELQENNKKMSLCMKGKNYNAGATGNVIGSPQELCAEEYNFYQKDGQWHSYDSIRKG